MQTKAECNHFWEIAIAEGPTSLGVCKYCGKTKDFQNFIYYETSQILLNKETHDSRFASSRKRGEFNKWVGN